MWEPIPGWEGYYVSNLGRVKGKRVDFLKPQCSERRGGYYYVDLRRPSSGDQSTRWCADIHVLVALAFLGPCPKGCVVHHKDGNRRNSKLSNLEYVTYAINAQLKYVWLNV